jgi:hypothetical protein
MKKIIWYLLPLLSFLLLISLLSWKDVTKGPEFPKEVSGILENSCYSCHTTGAKADDAVKALDLLKWNELSKTKKISKLNDIQAVVKDGKMPPERFLKKNPKKALSEEDSEALVQWTKKEISSLMGES